MITKQGAANPFKTAVRGRPPKRVFNSLAIDALGVKKRTVEVVKLQRGVGNVELTCCQMKTRAHRATSKTRRIPRSRAACAGKELGWRGAGFQMVKVPATTHA